MEMTILIVLAVFLFGLGVFHLKAQSNIFGVILGIMMVVFGLFLFFDGIEYKSGELVTPQGEFQVNETLNITNVYTNLKSIDNNLNTVITMTMLLVGVYVMFNSGFNLAGAKQKA